MAFQQDITGDRFGLLTARQFVRRNDKREAIWRCECDCGKIVDVRMANLRNENTSSCGCLRGKRNVMNEVVYD